MHSPRPWRIERSSDYTGDPEDTTIQGIESADGKTVYYTELGYFKPREEDVRLICAAPDLLAALKWAHNELTFLNNVHATARNLEPLLMDIVRALNKAEGA